MAPMPRLYRHRGAAAPAAVRPAPPAAASSHDVRNSLEGPVVAHALQAPPHSAQKSGASLEFSVHASVLAEKQGDTMRRQLLRTDGFRLVVGTTGAPISDTVSVFPCVFMAYLRRVCRAGPMRLRNGRRGLAVCRQSETGRGCATGQRPATHER